MLDENLGALLSAVNGCCDGEGYKIVEEKELLARFPAGAGVDANRLRAMLDCLRDSRYIDIRYEEDGVYCLRPLPEGRRYFDSARTESGERRRMRRDMALFSLLGGGLGGLLGAAAFGLLSLLF